MGWKKKPSSFAVNVKHDAESLIKNIGRDLVQGVIVATPVDEGVARGNWIASKAPDHTYDMNRKDKTGQGTINKCFVFFAQNAKLGSVIYLQNNLPYIERLENGHSQEQAPHGMVSVTMNAIKQKYGG
ncbi:hypothetical protein GPS47_11485 [Acinetobacter haemolyticus]|uniref:hypothetical protein n=1 Tax=Acinetobacter haemolyticus TaxID=29430 RepID=UPI000E58944A|nr:hypothetical protein [Acinetobacter haemolyticus]NAS06206.1 hypothetical protein [Acinetobacter haemolyticus]QDJ92691.1 hypothetical protein AhaeAN54_011720 [Acinetobacter haemolyticus]